ncbi:hypothetical protein [Actinoplanes sp. NPDC026619]|uniref:hypothetical protein n=1 Tax=Actinoplanes sp. NPDC026619 TaxID=3155798 RepID=UPI00340CA3CB
MPNDWRNSLRLAADLALLGIVVTLLSLPLLTAGAAVATGSYAIGHLIAEGRWPTFADLWPVFRRRLVPGLIAGPAVAAAATLVVIDVAALRRGTVPGGAPVLTAVLIAAVLAVGYLALVAVRAGATARAGVTIPAGDAVRAGAGIRSAAVPSGTPAGRAMTGGTVSNEAPAGGAVRSALTIALARPVAPLAAAGVLGVAALLGWFVHPALVPVLAGYALFALHVVTSRVAGREAVAAA